MADRPKSLIQKLKRKSSIFTPRKPKQHKPNQLIPNNFDKIEQIKLHLSKVVEKCEWYDQVLEFNQGTTDRRLASFERKVLAQKYKFPRAFVELYQKCDGCSEELFFTSLTEIKEQINVWRDLTNDGYFDDPKHNQHKNTDHRVNLKQWFHPGWIPISNNNGDHIIMDLAPTTSGRIGQIFQFSHETGFVRYLADNIIDYLLQIQSVEHF